MRDVLLTQGTVWFLGQAGKRFGGVGALAAWRDGYSWMRVSGVLARPGIKQQAEQPHECDQCELVEKQVRHHGNAPSHRCEIGSFYLAFEARQLSATLGDATNPLCHGVDGSCQTVAGFVERVSVLHERGRRGMASLPPGSCG
jgi:hypothetical protein